MLLLLLCKVHLSSVYNILKINCFLKLKYISVQHSSHTQIRYINFTYSPISRAFQINNSSNNNKKYYSFIYDLLLIFLSYSKTPGFFTSKNKKVLVVVMIKSNNAILRTNNSKVAERSQGNYLHKPPNLDILSSLTIHRE